MPSSCSRVRRRNDEVLQGPSDIRIDIDYWTIVDGNTIRSVHGDSNNLLNYYNFNGGHFMLEDGLLTIEPDSVAKCLVAMDHEENQIYNLLNPRVHPGSPNVTTNEAHFTATGTISLFKGYPPLITDEVHFAISYSFIENVRPPMFQEMAVYLDSLGLVHVDWKTYQTPTNLVEFRVQKSPEDVDDSYATISGGVLPAAGAFLDTVSYSFTDHSSITGGWFYRVAQVQRVGPNDTVIGITAYSETYYILVP